MAVQVRTPADSFNWDHYATPAAPAQDIANIKQWYQQYLGRPASDAEAAGWANNPNGMGVVEQAIAQSPEAKARAPQAGATGGASGAGDPEGFRAAWFASGGKTTDDLKAFVAAHPEFGATITGSKGSKLTFPGGQAFQAVRSAGLGGGIGPAWDDLGSGGSDSGSGYAGGGSTGLAAGSLMVPWEQQFTAPTAEQALQSPGLQFALDEANRIGQNSAAARGTLLNGRVQQALQGSNVQNALQGYGDVYNRGVGEYMLSRENFYNNQDRPFNKLSSLANLGAGASAQTGAFGSGYGNNATGSLGDIGNANSAGSSAQGNIWSNYLNNIGAGARNK